MDKLQKAQKMAEINLMRKKLAERKAKNEPLEKLVLELILAGTDKDQIAQILAIRENLTPQEERGLREIVSSFMAENR